MKPLDDELRKLLRRREPPDGFAARVLGRLRSESPAQKSPLRNAPWWRRPALGWIAAAVCLLMALGVARYEHQRRMRAQTEQASRQAIWALEIAGSELNTALQQAQRITAQALAAPENSKTRTE